MECGVPNSRTKSRLDEQKSNRCFIEFNKVLKELINPQTCSSSIVSILLALSCVSTGVIVLLGLFDLLPVLAEGLEVPDVSAMILARAGLCAISYTIPRNETPRNPYPVFPLVILFSRILNRAND